MKKSRLLSALVASAISLITMHAQAMLVERDWQTVGDGLITYDPQTGLEWLDLTVTANRTYDDIMADQTSSGPLTGWHFATDAEVLEFWAHADIPTFGFHHDPANFDPVLSLLQLVGILHTDPVAPDYFLSWGGTFDGDNDGSHNLTLLWTRRNNGTGVKEGLASVSTNPQTWPNDWASLTHGFYLIRVVSKSIAIDIKPSKNTANTINLRKDKNLKVAIVGTVTFDALQVDPTKVTFGLTGTEASPVRSKAQDFNRDGFSDLVMTFQLKDTGIACGNTEAVLIGQTYPEPVLYVSGSDSFVVEPCP